MNARLVWVLVARALVSVVLLAWLASLVVGLVWMQGNGADKAEAQLQQRELHREIAESFRAGRQETTQLSSLSESNARRRMGVRPPLEAQLTQLQTTNAAKPDEMRATVDEKLQITLLARLGESFKQVADRLELVHKGLGEMQTVAQGVGALKHLLTNVKTRGIFGEAPLAMGRVLKKVAALPDTQAQALIPVDKDFDRDVDCDVTST